MKHEEGSGECLATHGCLIKQWMKKSQMSKDVECEVKGIIAKMQHEIQVEQGRQRIEEGCLRQ